MFSIMPEETNEFEERATLTQRRQMGGAAKLSRAKSEPSLSNDDSKESSTGKIVIWVVAIVTIAAASYFGIKTYLNKPDDTVNPTVTPTVQVEDSLTDKIVNGAVLADSQASNVKATSAYNTLAQSVGKASTTDYTLDEIAVQKYTSFTRFTFTVGNTAEEGTTVEPFPVVSAAYDTTENIITLTFTQMSGNTTGFTTSEKVTLDTVNIQDISYDTTALEKKEKYIIQLNNKAGYVMQAISGTDKNIVVDVLDPKVIDTVATTVKTTTTTTPSVSTTTTVTPSTTVKVTTTTAITPTAIVSSGSATPWGRGTQQITSALTTNTFAMADGFKYADNWTSAATGETYSGMFTFEKGLTSSTTIPNVTATMDADSLTVQISNYNIASRALQTIPTSGTWATVNVKKLEASVANHVLTYVFTITKEADYRITFDTEHKVLLIQVKN
jgi:hypothetical protein